MHELKVHRDRCNGSSAIIHISAANLRSSGDSTSIEFPLGDDPDFAIYFDIGEAVVDEDCLESARRLMLNIDSIDNKVQEQCALECNRSGLHPRNYEGMLAFITILRGTARLHYFGTDINTEWDEIVEDRNGVWEYAGTIGAAFFPHEVNPICC
jgi:hypothetical protein